MGRLIVQSPDNVHVVENTIPKIFLAGCANIDWRRGFVDYFNNDCIIYDPKRDDFDKMTLIDKTQQIIWEYQKLDESDIIVFHFNGGSVCPITLLEYGVWGLSKTTPIAVYVGLDYEKRDDLILQTGLARSEVPIFDREIDLIDRTKLFITEWYNRHGQDTN